MRYNQNKVSQLLRKMHDNHQEIYKNDKCHQDGSAPSDFLNQAQILERPPLDFSRKAL